MIKLLARAGRLVVGIVLPLLAMGVCVVLYRWAFVALLERLLPSQETLVTVFRRVGSVAAVFLGYWAAARYYERRRLTELAFRPLPTAVSALVGIALIGLTIVSLFALGAYRLESSRGLSAALPLMGTITLMVIVEEAIFRGVVFRRLEEDVGTVWALAVQPLAFGLFHLSNEGATARTVISVTLLGAFWTLLYVHSRNLWVVIANHVAWNLTIFVSGLPLSGSEEWRLAAPLESVYEGPVWLTGGTFGPEDSILNLLVVVCAIGVLARRTWRKGAARPARTLVAAKIDRGRRKSA